MVNSNPGLQSALNDPSLLASMSNPAMMQQAMGMMGGAGGAGGMPGMPGAGGAGGAGGMPGA